MSHCPPDELYKVARRVAGRWLGGGLLGILAAAICFGFCANSFAAEKQYVTWSDYGGSADSMQYSALTQINKTNVTQLKPAWFFPVPGDPQHLPFNPLIIDNVMYVAGTGGGVVALNAATGNPIWASTEGRAPERGLAYWESKDRSDRRLVVITQTGLKEIDAQTGQAIGTFGQNGFVDMRVGDVRPMGMPNRTPARVFENLLIVGSNTSEGYGSAPGDLRAYDVVTGNLVWIFHTIPQPGEFGFDSYQNTNAWKYVGGANTWGEVSVDAKNGIVFFPTGSPTYDLYGADRIGDDLFGNCLIALDARTGKRLWHFQTVHHDLWDYDLAAAPKLLTVRHNGKPMDIVAQAGKTGFLYVFERLTGKPLWPIVEKLVPKSEVPGEVSSPTQPIPSKPPPFTRQSFTLADVNPYASAPEQEEIQAAVREAASESVFTPSSEKHPQIEFPGAWGGANWGATAADPATGWLFVRTLAMPSYRKMSIVGQGVGARRQGANDPENPGFEIYMQMCASCHGPGQTPMKSPGKIGPQNFRTLLRQGHLQMPPFPEEVLPATSIDRLEWYLNSLPPAEGLPEQGGESAPLRLPPNPNRYSGPAIRYAANFSAGWYTSNGLPTIRPPWTELVAYDLNEGTIKWRVPDGFSPRLAAAGITNTGSVRPRNGPVVTAGGLVFIANSQDGFVRAYAEDTGKVVWEYELDANPEGIPAVFEIDGREYIAFAAGVARGTYGDPVSRNPAQRKEGKIAAQGYYVFSLPKKNPAGGN
jgi:quinoprotein glucose dehydrogenase